MPKVSTYQTPTENLNIDIQKYNSIILQQGYNTQLTQINKIVNDDCLKNEENVSKITEFDLNFFLKAVNLKEKSDMLSNKSI